jgi:hypothetical protein
MHQLFEVYALLINPDVYVSYTFTFYGVIVPGCYTRTMGKAFPVNILTKGFPMIPKDQSISVCIGILGKLFSLIRRMLASL